MDSNFWVLLLLCICMDKDFSLQCERCGARLDPGWGTDSITGEQIITHFACPGCDSTYPLPDKYEELKRKYKQYGTDQNK